MNLDNVFDPQILFSYLWVGYFLYLTLIILVTLAILYNWSKYSGKKVFWFRFSQSVFMTGIVVFIIIATFFYLQLKI